MKNIFFITISIAFFLSAPLCSIAQDNVQADLSVNTVKSTKSPQFIDNIELVPEAPTAPNDYSGSEPILMPPKNLNKRNLNSTSIANMDTKDEDAYLENCSPLQFKYAILTDRAVELIKDTALYQFIDNWIGTPYMYGGSTKDGIDCSSFTSQLMADIFKLSIPRTAKEQYDACVRIRKDDLKEGDLVFFNTMGKRHGVSHVGVYLGNDYFVHSSSSSGVMISSLDEDYYTARFVSGGRLN